MPEFSVTYTTTQRIRIYNARNRTDAIAQAKRFLGGGAYAIGETDEEYEGTAGTNFKAEPARMAEATELLKSKAHEGDHGFTGDALKVWKRQRTQFLIGLRAIAAGRAVPHSVRDFLRGEEDGNYCPQEVQHSGGTHDGERWANAVSNILDE